MNVLKPNAGANQVKKRLGRGPGSGLGKTSGKGHKGQKARKGVSIPAGFEGGQNPLYRRLPKRGFRNIFSQSWNIVNLDDLVTALKNEKDTISEINAEVLKKWGFIRLKSSPVKILGRVKEGGDLSIFSGKKLVVQGCSDSAQKALSVAGAQIEKQAPVKTVLEKGKKKERKG